MKNEEGKQRLRKDILTIINLVYTNLEEVLKTRTPKSLTYEFRLANYGDDDITCTIMDVILEKMNASREIEEEEDGWVISFVNATLNEDAIEFNFDVMTTKDKPVELLLEEDSLLDSNIPIEDVRKAFTNLHGLDCILYILTNHLSSK